MFQHLQIISVLCSTEQYKYTTLIIHLTIHITNIPVMEMTGIRNRIFAGVMFSLSFSIGNVVASLFAHNFRNDNYIQFAILIPNIALACVSLLV